MTAIQKVPTALLQELAGAAVQVQRNAGAIYALLDRKACPVKVADIQKELGIGPGEYKSARQLLQGTSAEVYITQDGLVLKKYLSTDEQRYWHLAWSLGLLEVSGEQLVMDEDLLQKVPAALAMLIKDGKLRQHDRLSRLRTKAQKTIGTLAKVVNMYRQVDRALGIALLPKVTGKDWDDALGEIKKQLKSLPPAP